MDAPRDPARQETEPRRDATDLAAATTVPLAGPLGAGHASPLAGAPPPGRIGGHDLLDRIAQGGMGVVYRARQVGLERVVALKVLRAGTDADEGETARFRQEARNAARLQHPNIVRVLDCGEEEGRLWFTMDYIEGRSLAKGIATERITPVRAARLALPLAEALAYAHAQGVIHRDVKPANVLLDAADEPHLADFGIARDVRAGSRLTLTGTVMGTPAYMPPEQARGDTGAVGPRSDVYALGATLFECLCLRPPFEGGSPGEVLSRVLREDPARVRRLAPQVPRDLALIVETAMAKDPARRYAGAAEMAADLRRFLAREPVLARAPSLAYRTWRHARRNPWAAALAALLLAAAAGVVAARELTMRRLLREGWDERSRWVQALHERNDARDALGAIEEETPPGLPLAQKGELLQARRALRDAEGRLFEHFYGGLDAFGAVLGLDADRPEALRGLAELYVDYLRAAEEDGDEWGVLEASAYVRHYDPEGRHVRLDSPVPVRVASDPPGAAVWLYRYEPDRDHLRLLPLPCGPSGRLASAADSPPIPPTPETDDLRGPDTTPFPLRREANRAGETPLTLALGPGSYLALLERPGRAEARLPFLVPLSPPAGRTLDLGTVRLLEEGQVPPGFVYVPAGTSILGGDPEARSAGPRRKRTMAGFLLARFEVTVAEYREYLDLEGIPSYHHPAGLPGDLPAGSIRWADAHAYCQWSGRRTGLPCRLPMADEWERAARGADGRAFPWGEGFDGTFALTAAAGASVRLLPVGTYAADESPFGVRDLAGSLTEWCDLWYDLGLGLRPVRGGDFMDREPSIVRSASRAGDTGGALAPHRGLRVCLDLPAAD